MSSFEFATATEIVFGRGRAAELGQRSARLGQRALLVTGSNPARFPRALESLAAARVETVGFVASGEPTVGQAEQGVALARAERVELVIAMGGGSALDLGKAIAGLCTNPGPPIDYLEVIGGGRSLERPPLPFVAVPTTAGTGSEVTKNAVLAAEQQGVKVSLRHLGLLPRIALVDSELTHSVPPAITAATGLDALTQVLEPYVSRARGPMTDVLCLEGMRRSARSLWAAFVDGNDADAREDLALTSLFGGLALANAKLGAVHGLAGPLGGSFDAPHGALCARLLPEVMKENLRALAQAGDRESLERYRIAAEVLTGRPGAHAEAGVAWVAELVERLGIPRLAHYGVTDEHFQALVQRARAASSMKGNPVALSADAVQSILQRAL